MAKARKICTCTTMIMTDGTTSHYAVMQGPMRGRSFLAHEADIVATYEVKGAAPDYHAMTARHASSTAPAVYWQA